MRESAFRIFVFSRPRYFEKRTLIRVQVIPNTARIPWYYVTLVAPERFEVRMRPTSTKSTWCLSLGPVHSTRSNIVSRGGVPGCMPDFAMPPARPFLRGPSDQPRSSVLMDPDLVCTSVFLLLFELMNFMPTPDTNAAMGGGVTCAAVLLVRLAPPPARAARAVSPWEAGGYYGTSSPRPVSPPCRAWLEPRPAGLRVRSGG